MPKKAAAPYGFRPPFGKIVGLIVLAALVVSAAYALIAYVRAPAGAAPDVVHGKVKSDYVLMLLESLLGIFVLFLPALLEKRFRIAIPSRMYVIFVVFLFGAIVLGEIRDFYYRIAHWDLFLHAFSGIMLAALGFSIVSLLNKSERVAVNLSPHFVALFAFCFAVTLGVMWESYEFLADGLLGLNMQKFALEDKTLLAGRAALVDTMEDLIVDALAAFGVSVFGYLSMKAEKRWIARVGIKKIPPAA